MPVVTTEEHRGWARLVRQLMAAHARSEDLVRMGAYSAGTDKELDRAMVAMPRVREYLQQDSDECFTMRECVEGLQGLAL